MIPPSRIQKTPVNFVVVIRYSSSDFPNWYSLGPTLAPVNVYLVTVERGGQSMSNKISSSGRGSNLSRVPVDTVNKKKTYRNLFPTTKPGCFYWGENSWKNNRHHKQRLAAEEPGCFNRKKQLEKRMIDGREYLSRLMQQREARSRAFFNLILQKLVKEKNSALVFRGMAAVDCSR